MGNLELISESNKNLDHAADKPAVPQLSSSALDLMKEKVSSFASSAASVASSFLPEISFFNGARPSDDGSNNPNLTMGNPSDARADQNHANNYLVLKDQYVLSYNKDHKTPNWASWQLDSDWIGSSGRAGQFTPDESLPADFDRATPGDYKGTGYDRGHNVPSGDRTRSKADNEATFLMSNIAPQTGDNNRGPWEKLELYSRELAKEGKELYIVAGSEGSKGTIGNGVNVPEAWFKVAVVLPQKGMGLKDVNEKTEVIAIEIPNETGMMRDDWRKYITTVDEIEKHTGYNFFSKVPENVQRVIEAKRYGN